MDLHETLSSVLTRYGSGKKESFAAHPVAALLRRDARDCIACLLQDDRYVVTRSAGQGTWANVPWIGVFDRFITTSAQEGFYIVYLFRSDRSGVYLSLNQDVTRGVRRTGRTPEAPFESARGITWHESQSSKQILSRRNSPPSVSFRPWNIL